MEYRDVDAFTTFLSSDYIINQNNLNIAGKLTHAYLLDFVSPHGSATTVEGEGYCNMCCAAYIKKLY